MLTPGRHVVRITGSKIDRVGQNGTPCVRVFAEVASTGESVEAKVWLTEKAIKMARGQLRGLGFNVDEQSLAELDETGLLVGREVEFVLKEKEWQGKLRAEWEVPTPRQPAGDLDALLRGAASSASKEWAAKAPPPPAPIPTSSGIPKLPPQPPFQRPASAPAPAAPQPIKQPDIPDDDIPF